MASWQILLAEDEPLMAQMMVDMLAELPVEVVVARDGREALARVQEQRPDLILLDAIMPELDGWQVAAALKGDPATADIPVVFLTARARTEDKVRGLELGAEDYLVKPVQREEMLARVKNVLRRSESRRAARPPESPGMRGRLEVMRLANLVQALQADRRTGTLHVGASGRRGQILFLEGRVAYAMEGPREGEAAVFTMLTWEEGSFELELTSGSGPASAEVARSNETLLLEGARRQDEIPALRKALAELSGPIQMFPLFREGLLRRTLPGGFHRLVHLCDGSHDLGRLLESSSLDEWATLTLLGRLHALGMLQHGHPAKRRAPRLGIQIPVQYQSLTTFRPAQTLDVSARGIFLSTAEVFPVGEELMLRFNLPGVAHQFRTVGRVVWSSSTGTSEGLPAGMGVQFADMEAAEQGILEQYVVELLLDRVLITPPESAR